MVKASYELILLGAGHFKDKSIIEKDVYFPAAKTESKIVIDNMTTLNYVSHEKLLSFVGEGLVPSSFGRPQGTAPTGDVFIDYCEPKAHEWLIKYPPGYHIFVYCPIL